MRTGARRTTSRSGRSTCSTTRCCASRCALEHVKPRLLGHWGTTPGLNFALRAPQPGDPRARPRRRSSSPAPATAGRASWPTPTWRAPTARSTRTSAATRRACGGCSASSRSRAASRATSRRRRRARSTRAASSATRWRTPTAPRSTTPTCSSCCVVGDGEAETGPLAASWHSNKFLDPARDGAVLPDPAPQRLQDRQPDGAGAHPARTSCARCWRATATRRTSSRATTRPTMHQQHGGDAGRRSATRSPRSSAPARDGGVDRAPALADDRAAHAQGLDGAEGGRRPAGRGHLALAPGAARRAREQPRAPRAARGRGCAPTGPRSSSTSAGALRAELAALAPRGRPAHGREPARQRRRCCCATSSCPTSATTPSTCPRPARTSSEADPRARRAACATSCARNPRPTSGSSAPTRPRRTACGAVFEVTDRAWMAERCSTATTTSRPTAASWRCSREHLCQGWLEGYLLTGRHGLFNCYEAFIHIVDSMFNQHAKWLKVTREIPWRRPIAVAELPAHARTSGARTTTASPTRTRASSTTSSTRRPRSSGSTCRRTPTACCRSPTTACAAATTSTSSWPASSPRSTTCRWTRRSRTARAGIGIWEWASNDDGGEPDVVLACAGDVPTLETLAAAALLREHLPELRVRVVNVVDLMRLQPETEHPHGLSDARVRRAVHHRPAGDLRLPRLPVADPPAHLPAHEPRTTSTCAATRRRAPRRRRSTWSCSTTWTASTSSST